MTETTQKDKVTHDFGIIWGMFSDSFRRIKQLELKVSKLEAQNDSKKEGEKS